MYTNYLVFRSSCPLFAELEALRVKEWSSTPRFASAPERRKENKYIISSGDRDRHNQLCLQSHTWHRQISQDIIKNIT